MLSGKVEFLTKQAEKAAGDSASESSAPEPLFRPLTPEAFNSIVRRAKKERVCKKGSPKTEITEFVYSEDIPAFNPILEFLKDLITRVPFVTQRR